MQVEIRTLRDGADTLAGRLRLDSGRIVAEPPDSRLLAGILGESVYDPQVGQVLTAEETPEEWLRALHVQYRSAYLRASEPVEDGADDDGGSTLAQHYASLWNTMQAHGEDVGHEHLHDAAGELSGTNWRATRRPDGRWVAHRFDDHAPLRRWKGHEPAIVKEAQHAPKGGIFLVNMKGESHFYVGGQWIPAKEVANLPPAEKAKLQQAVGQAKHAAKMTRVARGNIDAGKLQARLQPHARELSGEEHWRADREMHALTNYHGALTLHRIEELARQQAGFLKRKNLTDKQQKQIEGNLARLHAMVGLAQARGITGQIPKALRQQAILGEPVRPKPASSNPARVQPKRTTPEEWWAAQEDYHAGAEPKAPETATEPSSSEAPLSPDQAAAALAKQAGHVTQPREGEDAASQLNRQLIAEDMDKGKEEPKAEVKPAEKLEADRPQAKEGPRKESQQDESAFHAAWNEALGEDTTAQKQIANGDLNAARERVLRKLIGDGVAIPERVKQKYADAFKKASEPSGGRAAAPEGGGQPPPALEEKASPKSPDPVDESLQAQTEAEHTRRRYGSGKDRTRYWSDRAFENGIKPKDLFAAAEMILHYHDEDRDRRRKLLARAREMFAGLGYNAQALTTNLRHGYVEDEVKGLDQVSYSLAHEFPEEFGGDSYLLGGNELRDDGQRLLDMFTEGVPPTMTKDTAYEKALEYLQELMEREKEQSKQSGGERERELGQDDEDEEEQLQHAGRAWDDDDEDPFADPFGSQWKSLRAWLRKSLRAWLRKSRRRPDAPGQTHLFDSDKHPRAPKGGPHGGEFTLGGGGTAFELTQQEVNFDRGTSANKKLAGLIETGLQELQSQGIRLPNKVQIKPMSSKRIAAWADNNDPRIGSRVTINPRCPYWSNPVENAKKLHADGQFSTGSPIHPLLHEIGHTLTKESIGVARYDRLRNVQFSGVAKEAIAREVSKYAITNGVEFVAETFAGLSSGKHYSDLVMRQYHELGGAAVVSGENVGQAEPAASGSPQAKIDAALARHAAHQSTPQSGGGLFGVGDLESRRGFARLPDGAPIVFTTGEFAGQTGRIVRDQDALTGTPRIVASVDGREGLVPIAPDAIEPLQEHQSWRTEGGGSGAGTVQGGLYTADQFLPKREEK